MYQQTKVFVVVVANDQVLAIVPATYVGESEPQGHMLRPRVGVMALVPNPRE